MLLVMRIGGAFGSAVLIMTVLSTAPATAATQPEVAARAVYVVDSARTVHYSKRATKRAPVASLVKIMTAYVVLREARLSDVVTIKKVDVRHAIANGATSASLVKGERRTVEELLHGLMLPSGADASNALARAYGPGKSAFVAKMNAAAKRLGMADTLYTNADGLPSRAYSTPADQATLTMAALANPTFRAIVSRRTYKIPGHTWRNSNQLLGSEGVIGVKTGFTTAAGFCLAFAADRGGRRIVGVLLGDQDKRRFRTAEQLLDYAESRIAGS
ncbi:D-alanyl-D-alanine carboxypeptidase family protein [Nonomuraea sp. NPDC050663]|uniref:D-alanyl-D-alanine carboxypeptidase family protein n=1 Tax=Nonomuraea sp. NPDC050663 TaxID=3364370 RepID=UPI0037B70978